MSFRDFGGRTSFGTSLIRDLKEERNDKRNGFRGYASGKPNAD